MVFSESTTGENVNLVDSILQSNILLLCLQFIKTTSVYWIKREGKDEAKRENEKLPAISLPVCYLIHRVLSSSCCCLLVFSFFVCFFVFGCRPIFEQLMNDTSCIMVKDL